MQGRSLIPNQHVPDIPDMRVGKFGLRAERHQFAQQRLAFNLVTAINLVSMAGDIKRLASVYGVWPNGFPMGRGPFVEHRLLCELGRNVGA